jgi:2,4-diketo-3-deoxy-L-fuconate hydrolase
MTQQKNGGNGMRLFRHGPLGSEAAGAVDARGVKRDISLLAPDFTPDWLAPEKLNALSAIDLEKMPQVPEGARIGAPVAGSRQFIAIGLNYRKHAAESGMTIPNDPLVFNKALTCIQGPNDDIVQPERSEKLDWEVELGFYIGTKAQRVSKENALKYVAGYCLANDVSERQFQIERSGQWTKGKSAETFGPIGPWLVTKDEIPNPQKLDMWLTVNGESRQNGSTRTMIFGAAHIVWYCSQFMVLQPGDVIITGTPPGVAMGMKPEPKFLKAGDIVKLGIAGLGEQRQKVVRFRA